MSKFQIILLVAFGAFLVIAVMVFSFYRGSGTEDAVVTVWGDIPQVDFNALINATGINQDRSLRVVYQEVPLNRIEEEFTEALARGAGPDLIILPLDKYWKHKSKLIPIPYKSISESDFQSTFIEAAELYLDTAGVYALPISIDPMVMYYNRDMLSAAGVARPITYWDEIYSASLALTKKDAAGNITQSAIALGEARNISHAKDILALLMLQAGTPITSYVGENLRAQISQNFNFPVTPAESALDFYTQFSNPSRPYYSWNRTMVEAQTRFTSGDSAYYIGFASELRALRSKNPTLNFHVTSVPQSRVSGNRVTFGRLRGISIARNTKNANAALSAMTKLVSRDVALELSEIELLPPPRRDLLSNRPSDAVLSVFYDAALQSKAWLDPDDVRTSAVFIEMIESVTSGRARTVEAVRNANTAVGELIEQ